MLPQLTTQIPGPQSLLLAQRLKKVESRNVTFVSSSFPIFWEHAQGSNVWDVDGNRFLDFTSGFGVATAGFGAEHLVSTFQHQASSLYHAMGDVHPTQTKVELCEALSRITFERWGLGPGKTVLGCAGSEAVEIALKTAFLKTGKSEVIAFTGGYHGLGYGALTVTGREEFRTPFRSQLKDFAHFLPYPHCFQCPFGHPTQANQKLGTSRPCGEACPTELEKSIRQLAQLGNVGAILVEPVQGRGGEVVPPDWFLPMLRRVCDEKGLVLIFDEIYTGFYRTGTLMACDRWGVAPDIICLGKALSGSFPISACVGKAAVMDAWPESAGEALHTSTFLGHPVGCALALASIKHWLKPETLVKVRTASAYWAEAVAIFGGLKSVADVRGAGLLWGVELRDAHGHAMSEATGKLMEEALAQGLILLGGGVEGNVISLSPSISTTKEEVSWGLGTLRKLIEQI